MTKMFTPKITTQTAAAAPTVNKIEAPKRELGGDDKEDPLRKRKGRNALRIDPQTGGVNSNGGNGINVPMK